MALTDEQKAYFKEHGYLKYGRVLTDDEVETLRERSLDIIEGRVNTLPPRYLQFEAKFRENPDPNVLKIDQVRKMTQVCYFDPLFQAAAKKPAITDIAAELLGSPNVKLYTDQLMMKPRFFGTVTDWHQDSTAWPFFAPQDHVSCWVALDDATVDNGCMTVIPGSHHWGPIAREYKQKFLANPELPTPVPVEIKAGECMFHHGLNWHRTGANTTPSRRRGLALHYITAETMYLGIEDEEARLMTECEKPKGEFRFLLVRGQEIPGRV